MYNCIRMKSTRNIVFSNTFFQFLGRFSQQIYVIILSFLVIRFYGNSLWGEYSVLANFVGFFYVLADLGINQTLQRDIGPANIKNSTLLLLLKFRFLLGLVLAFISLICAYFLGYFSYFSAISVILSSFLILFFGLSISVMLLYQARLKYESITRAIVGSTALSIALSVMLHMKGLINLEALILIALLNLIFTIVFLLISSGYSFKSSYLKFGIDDFKNFKLILNGTVLLGLTLFLNNIMFNVDKLILPFFVNSSEVGVYSFAYKLFEIFLLVPTFIMGSFYPLLLKVKDESQESFKKLFSSSMFLVICSWLILAPIFLFLINLFVPIIWGVQVISSLPIIRYFVLFACLFFVTSPLYWLAIIENKTKQLFFIYLTAAVINVLLNLYFIPLYGVYGAVITTIATEFYVLLAMLLVLRKFLSKDFAKIDGFRSFLGSKL